MNRFIVRGIFTTRGSTDVNMVVRCEQSPESNLLPEPSDCLAAKRYYNINNQS